MEIMRRTNKKTAPRKQLKNLSTKERRPLLLNRGNRKYPEAKGNVITVNAIITVNKIGKNSTLFPVANGPAICTKLTIDIDKPASQIALKRVASITHSGKIATLAGLLRKAITIAIKKKDNPITALLNKLPKVSANIPPTTKALASLIPIESRGIRSLKMPAMADRFCLIAASLA
jgi:hypothetical protein